MQPPLISHMPDLGCDFVARPDHPLPLDDRGLQYGHGLFETVRMVSGVAPLFERHLQRAIDGLAQLQIIADEGVVRDWFSQIVAQCSGFDGLLKIILTAGSGGAGYRSPAQFTPRCRYTLLPLPADLDAHRQRGIALWRCAYRLPHNPRLAGFKHLNRLDQLLARSEWSGGEFVDGLVQSESGDCIESTAGNLFIYTGEQWQTPRLDRCGVRGVMRDYLIDQLLPANGYRVAVVRLSLEQLSAAKELFFCNSVRGIVPVVALSSGQQWPLGEQTAKLAKALAAALPGYPVAGR